MKAKIVILLLAFAMLAVFPANAQSKDTLPPILYENREVGFYVELPPDWAGLFEFETFDGASNVQDLVGAYLLHKPTKDGGDWYYSILGTFGRRLGHFTQENPPAFSETRIVLAHAGGYTFYFTTPNDPDPEYNHVVRHQNSDSQASASYSKFRSQLNSVLESFGVIEDALPPAPQGEITGHLVTFETLGISFVLPTEWEGLLDMTTHTFDYGRSALTIRHGGTIYWNENAGHLFTIHKIPGVDEYDDDNPPVKAGACWILAKTGGYTYAISTPSDVQYDEAPDSTSREEYLMIRDNFNQVLRTFKVIDSAEPTSPIYPTRPGNPIYNVDTVSDEEGLTDSYTYNFPSGSILANPGDILLMVNGEFIPHMVEIRESRSLVPLRFVTQAFGASVEWDADIRTASLTLGNTTAIVTIGDQFATVYKNGVTGTHDLYTPAVIIDDRSYVPVRALAEIFDKESGYEEAGVKTYNPFVWIDEKTPDWQPDIEALQEKLTQALVSMKENAANVIPGWESWDSAGLERAFAEIANNIENMKYLRHIGRYALVDGPYSMLVDQDGTVYFHKTGYLIWIIHEADFEDPQIFISGYFTG